MKKTIVKFVSRKFIPTFIFSTSLLTFAPIASTANSNGLIEIVSNENSASVQFSGSSDNALLFDVKVNNSNGDTFTLLIKNEAGDILFTKEYSDKNFSKRIKLLKNDDNSRYTFNIRSTNKDLENSFGISTAVKVVDDVVVTKL